MYFQRKNRYCIRSRNDSCGAVSLYVCDYCDCCSFDSCRSEPLQILLKEEGLMKVVVVRSPKLLSGVLKMIFGIKRQDDTV